MDLKSKSVDLLGSRFRFGAKAKVHIALNPMAMYEASEGVAIVRLKSSLHGQHGSFSAVYSKLHALGQTQRVVESDHICRITGHDQS